MTVEKNIKTIICAWGGNTTMNALNENKISWKNRQNYD